jgi:hypothetical protein
MAGIKQFDRIEVLDRAMALSWTRGEEATSIQIWSKGPTWLMGVDLRNR